MARPKPRLPPVTMTLRMRTRQFASLADRQGRYEADHHRNLVLGQGGATAFEDFPPQRSDLSAGAAGLRLFLQDNLGHDDRAREGILSRAHERHPHVRMPIDDRLDLFGMDLQAADIDDAAFSADEMVAIAAQLQHVAGVHESFMVCQRRNRAADILGRSSVRTYLQRSVYDLHLYVAGLADHAGRKSFETVIDVEADARFGRSIGVADPCLRIESTKIVEDRLVRDLPRQPNILRRNCIACRAHQRTPPMRRRARDVRYATFAEAHEVTCRR